jgi:hypothetical protein
MLRGISSTCHFGHAKQCVINVFDTNCLLAADEVMSNILHLAWTRNLRLRHWQPLIDLPLRSQFLSLLVAVPVADVATTHVALAAAVDCPTNAAHVAV